MSDLRTSNAAIYAELIATVDEVRKPTAILKFSLGDAGKDRFEPPFC